MSSTLDMALRIECPSHRQKSFGTASYYASRDKIEFLQRVFWNSCIVCTGRYCLSFTDCCSAIPAKTPIISKTFTMISSIPACCTFTTTDYRLASSTSWTIPMRTLDPADSTTPAGSVRLKRYGSKNLLRKCLWLIRGNRTHADS